MNSKSKENNSDNIAGDSALQEQQQPSTSDGGTTSYDRTNAASSSQSGSIDTLKLLLNDNTTLKLPTTSGKLISLLGKYSKIEYVDWEENPSGWGNKYIWKFANGLILTAQSDGDGTTPNNQDSVRAIFMDTETTSSTDIAVYGLSLYKTTLKDCQQLLGSKLKKSRLGKDTYKIIKDNLYTYLTFNSGGILTQIKQITFDLETAG